MTDAFDMQILDLLQKDGRISNVQIAKQIGLSEGAIRRRISNLEKTGIITRYTIEMAPQDRVFALIMVKSKDDTKKMLLRISALNLFLQAYEISGEFDACLVIDGKSISEIDEKIDKIRKASGVLDTRTFIALKKW